MRAEIRRFEERGRQGVIVGTEKQERAFCGEIARVRITPREPLALCAIPAGACVIRVMDYGVRRVGVCEVDASADALPLAGRRPPKGCRITPSRSSVSRAN